MSAAIADAAAGMNIIMKLIPSTTPGAGTALATKPIAIRPRVTTALRTRIPSLIGKFNKAIVKALIFFPVFHSP